MLSNWINSFSSLELLTLYSFAPLLFAFLAASISLAVKNEWLKKMYPLKVGLAVLSVLAFVYIFLEELEHQALDFSFWNWILLISVALITFLFMGRHTHHHHSLETLDKKALTIFVLGIMIHGFLDGLVLGTSFLNIPILGITAGNLILLHEIPKAAAIAMFLRSLGLSKRKTLFYATIPQVAIPIASFGVYLSVKEVTRDLGVTSFAIPEVLHSIIVVFLLATIAAMIWKDISYHRNHKH